MAASLAQIPCDSPTEFDVSDFVASLSELEINMQINEIKLAVTPLSSRNKATIGEICFHFLSRNERRASSS